ncbi:Ring finger domain protein [Lasiodiplodia theobromae]|uniref:Ring finger domain protein n=1 Tax=Lasiodiplodia theobromae TaxID=45133 RepID=UPI0015C33A42|nr:Ring finger domain protein [Lasiodiplodia theobromae]KAF4538981.1 Ring finger domain protein [Lasiodiplodia theobromae]
MGVPDPTVNMSGVAAHDQPLSQPRSSGRKRKPVSYAEDQPSEGAESPVKKRRSKAAAQKLPTATVDNADGKISAPIFAHDVVELTINRFRDKAPQSFNAVKERALTQRMFVIERSRGGTDDCPEENVEIAGTTGNVYNVNISLLPSCTCPHAAKGHQCKHIIYVLIRVLKAPPQLQYQLAFVSSELRDIFSAAPPIPSGDTGDKDSGRKAVEGDCPICCEEFDDSEEIVWCKAACGNNVHKSCFEQWAATKGGHNVTCPYCRTPWTGDEDMLKKVVKAGEKNAEGYVNVASQLGLDGERDYSTYHPFWVRRQACNGAIDSSWRRFGL